MDWSDTIVKQMERNILETLYSSNNSYSMATFSDISHGSIYFRSIVTLPGEPRESDHGADLLKNTYYVIFKVPMNPELFMGPSYKQVPAYTLKDYYFKIVPAQPVGGHHP